MRTSLLASILIVASPLAAFAQCMYQVAPVTTLAEDGPPNPITGKPALQAHWAINCTGACDSNWSEGGNVDPYFAGLPLVQAGSGCGYLGDQVGMGTCTFDSVVGAKVIARIPGMFCRGNGGVATNDTNMQGESAPYVVAPYVGTLDQLAIMPNPLNDDPWSAHYDGDASKIPVGMPFRVGGFITVTPVTPEFATFRVEGGGISFTKVYQAQVNGAGAPQDVGQAWSYDQDKTNYVTATQAGPIQFWVEFEGTKSEVRTLTAVVLPGGTGGGGGSSSSSGGGSGGSGSMPKHGCTAFDGSWSLALAAAVSALARRRR